jgi:ATP adenylyltransferase/5',5'''-P-1,P-4-tetraphosphate phosphorylase II
MGTDLQRESRLSEKYKIGKTEPENRQKVNHMKDTQLTFLTDIGALKPNSIRNKETPCPFCRTDLLEEVIDKRGSIILVKNKYNVLEHAYQTVLIETDECEGELSEYNKDHLYQLLNFGLEHWERMMQSGKYRSVMFFKNHGPLSGGTIRHPHMQIVGLEDVDCQYDFSISQFEGFPILEEKGVRFTVSTEPRVGFNELNVIWEKGAELALFADCIQTAAHFLLNHFHGNCTSYNLFFYKQHETTYCKIMPRFITSPLYMGFGVQQVSNKVESMAQRIKDIYFSV